MVVTVAAGEMNETVSSSLAVTEKRAHRPGGCVGIFFQLFDWNRRFAKKKFFSRKMLPPVQAKQASKKFAVDEKMPKAKPHLIADENSCGFPNVKKTAIVEQRHEMRAPGLVARLMGLESLPTAHHHRDKHKKSSSPVAGNAKEEKLGNSRSGPDREDSNLDKGTVKVEFRPQKLQKTGQFERQAVTKFGAEALQIGSVLSRSRKHHHHPKLVPPLKSPRMSSCRNVSRTARLIDAATRILEPGLQVTNRAKSALMYSSSTNNTLKDELLLEVMGVVPPDVVRQQKNNPSHDVGVNKSLMGQTSCKNCGNLLDVAEEHPFVCSPSASNLVHTSSEKVKSRPPVSSPEHKRDAVYLSNGDQLSVAAGEHDNIQACNEPITDKKHLSLEGQAQQQLKSQHCRPRKDEASPMLLKQRTQPQNEMLVCRARSPSRAKLSNLQSRRASSAANAVCGVKDFVAMNRTLSGRTRPRMLNKADNSAIESERKFCSMQDDSMSQLRTPVCKRTLNINAQTDSSRFVNSVRQRNIKYDASGKDMGLIVHPVDHTCSSHRSASRWKDNRENICKDNNVVSFTFNSPLRQNTSISMGLKGRRDQSERNTPNQRKLVLDEHDGNMSLPKQSPLSGDALSALLEQKLKELISQEEDELTMGGTTDKQSTAMILQDLISALTAEQPISPDGHIFKANRSFQTEGKMGWNAAELLPDGNHLSPGSVLEASFSVDSCFSSGVDDSSGQRHLPGSIGNSYIQPQLRENDADLLDSATSINDGRVGSKMVMDLINRISRILQSINLAGGGLTGGKLTYAKEVIFNAELLFGRAIQCQSDSIKSHLVGPFLLDELETLAGDLWTNVGCVLGIEENKQSNQLRKFLFDCVIEYLDSKYGWYCNSGFKAWRRVPPYMKPDMLMREVGAEVRRWTSLVGMIPDKIIEWEMSHNLGKWMDFEIEAFEAGAAMDWEILQVLVDEVVTDLCVTKLGST